MIVKRGICRSGEKLIFFEAGSVVEQIQNCHVDIYMEGYHTHRNETVSTATT